MKIIACAIMLGLFFAPCQAWAEDYDGTKPLLCASIEAVDCGRGESCKKGLPEDMGLPQFMRVDFSRKEIVGPKRTTPIRLMEKSDGQLTLQGFEMGLGWTLALDRATGKTVVTLIGRETAVVVFGACTPLP